MRVSRRGRLSRVPPIILLPPRPHCPLGSRPCAEGPVNHQHLGGPCHGKAPEHHLLTEEEAGSQRGRGTTLQSDRTGQQWSWGPSPIDL